MMIKKKTLKPQTVRDSAKPARSAEPGFLCGFLHLHETEATSQ